MRRIKRTEIIVETDEVTIVRGLREDTLSLCPYCASPVAMVTAEQAAVMSFTDVRTIIRLVDEGRVHHLQTSETVFVCPRSFFQTSITDSYRLKNRETVSQD